MAVTKEDVVLIAPELSGVDDARFQAAIDEADTIVNIPAFGTRVDLAKRYYVAHLLTVAGQSGQGHGEVLSETVGAVSRTYAASSATTPPAGNTTRYWGEYMRVVRATLGGPRST